METKNIKLTDNEIIKALECCKNDGIICRECPYKKANGCMEKLSADALDLINRQKAEIEKLKIAFENQMSVSKYWKSKRDELAEENEWLQDTLETTKAAAVKEFAERLDKEFAEIASRFPDNKIVKQTAQVLFNTVTFVKMKMVGEE